MIMSDTFSVALAQGTWTTAQLSVARFGLAAASSGNFAIFAGGTAPGSGQQMSDAVDLYNFVDRIWSTARLSAARAYLAAASVGNVAIFAGGLYAGVSLLIFTMLGAKCINGRGNVKADSCLTSFVN